MMQCAVPCYAMPCYAMLCHAMCGAMLCCAVLCCLYALLRCLQVAVLANIPEQQQSGDTASEDDIGEELQACLAGHEEAESAAAKPVSLMLLLCIRNRQTRVSSEVLRGTCSSMTTLPYGWGGGASVRGGAFRTGGGGQAGEGWGAGCLGCLVQALQLVA